MSKIDRTGEINYNNFGSKMIITRYGFRRDIDVYFPRYNWTAYKMRYNDFKKGNIRCPYEPRLHGVGYLGEGNYPTRENGKMNKCYNTWKNMLKRCYDKKYQEKYPTYKGCTVCNEWHNYQVFAKWYYNNIYFIDNDFMCLDKDILCKGNKIYSPDTCIFVPNRINVLFTKSDKARGDYPIGVNPHKRDNILEVCCSTYENGKKKHNYIGRYPLNQVSEAFQCYKAFKENYIKNVADKYKDLIPEKLYSALYNYKVEITD